MTKLVLTEVWQKKKNSPAGNLCNKGFGGQGGGGYQRKTFNKTNDKAHQVLDKSSTKDKTKKRSKKSEKSGETPPKSLMPTSGVAQLGEHFQNMVTTSNDPNQVLMAKMIADLCQGKD